MIIQKYFENLNISCFFAIFFVLFVLKNALFFIQGWGNTLAVILLMFIDDFDLQISSSTTLSWSTRVKGFAICFVLGVSLSILVSKTLSILISKIDVKNWAMYCNKMSDIHFKSECMYCRFLIKRQELLFTQNCKKHPSCILKSCHNYLLRVKHVKRDQD